MTALRYKHIIFDLDGTISDSREGIFNAAIYTLEKLGLEHPTDLQLHSIIGPPLQQGFREVFNIDGDGNATAVKIFREYYGEKGLFENTLYPGITVLLQKLYEAGALLYVATSKFETYAHQVLQNFKIQNFFTDVAGADYKGIDASKIKLLMAILRRNGITSPDDVVMIGDTEYDIKAAAELDIDSIGVTYGFSSYEQIACMNPEYIAFTVEDIGKHCLGA